jgi:hypothetical protein
MLKKFFILETSTRSSILFSTFGLSVFVVVIFNAFFSMLYISELLIKIDLEDIRFSYADGYYYINHNAIGMHLFYTIGLVIALWSLMVCHTIKTLYKSESLFF